MHDVLVEQHQICKLASLDRALVVFLELCIRRTEGVRRQGVFDGNLLFGEPALRLLAVKGCASGRRI